MFLPLSCSGQITVDPFGILSGSLFGSMNGIFSYINAGLITSGLLFVAYKWFVARAKTVHDGDLVGKTSRSIWVPIKITTGVLLLIPVFGGWSLIQVLMWRWFSFLATIILLSNKTTMILVTLTMTLATLTLAMLILALWLSALTNKHQK